MVFDEIIVQSPPTSINDQSFSTVSKMSKSLSSPHINFQPSSEYYDDVDMDQDYLPSGSCSFLWYYILII